MRYLLIVAVSLLVTLASASAADVVVVEDWSRYPVGTSGIPNDWKGQTWGSPAYDFTVVEDGGHKALHMKSKDESSTISREIKGKVHLKETPVLEWRWKVMTLPKGGDSRKKETDDQAAQLYVTWKRFPEAVRSRIIGYVWDSTAPVGTIVKSEKTGTITYVVVRSGAGELGQWLTERRNVRDDFRRIHGEEPENPDAISVSIDSNDTHSAAESYIGPILFRKP
jgi:DUF3047 family protein